MIVSKNEIKDIFKSLEVQVIKLGNNIKRLKNIMSKLPEIERKIKIEQVQEKSCTCHRCLEGQQICGESINWVCGPIDKELPTKVHSRSSGLEWWFGENKFESEDQYWSYGSSVDEAVLDWVVYYSK